MDGLQFDKAEFTAGTGEPPAVCAACQHALAGDWFRVNEQPCCGTCTADVERTLGGRPGAAGFVKALIGGVAGGVVGALLYYLVLAVSGYEIGLLAIAVGFLVGKGVQWGTGGRGGPLYQALAIGLTYVAIVSTYVPGVIQGLREAQPSPAASASAPVDGVAATSPAAGSVAEQDAPVSLGGFLAAVAIFALLVLALPFLAGFQNILGLIIIAIGLYEAWKINRRVPLNVIGPFRTPAPTPAPPLPVPATPGA
jgi:hypothetical protein